jgi:hypothetical protein
MSTFQGLPDSLDELMRYCVANARSIYVHVELNGEVKNLPLAEIPYSRAMEIIAIWFVEEHWPHVLVQEEIPK